MRVTVALNLSGWLYEYNVYFGVLVGEIQADSYPREGTHSDV